jgi:uncharacterized protein YkwD
VVLLDRVCTLLPLTLTLFTIACAPAADQAPAAPLLPAPAPASQPATSVEPPAADAERFAWATATQSPQPAPHRASDAATPLAAKCGEADSALQRVAERLARRQASRLPPLDIPEITFALRAEGAPYVWPRAWSLENVAPEDPDAAARFERWLGSFGDGGKRRCGVAVATQTTTAIAAVVSDVLADLVALPTAARPGTWLEVQARLLVRASDAEIVVLSPTRPPFTAPTSSDGGRVRARFMADRPGSWLVQVLATTQGGPRPVAEAIVHVGEPPPASFFSSPAPGEEAAARSGDDETRAVLLVNAARGQAGLAALRRDERLDRIALAHAEAMHVAGRLGHDVGDGNPKTRIDAAGLRVRAVGENVAHAATLARAHRALWSSPSHRGNLLHRRFDALGVGVVVAPDQTVWLCQVFADFR